MLMGFYLPKNFDSPYKAVNTQQFWRRWHMSLSRWLRDYLYIPLGGNRNATPATFVIILAVAVFGSFLSGSWWVAFGVFVVAVGIGVWAWLRPGDHHAAGRPVARRQLELHDLGRPQRPGHGDL